MVPEANFLKIENGYTIHYVEQGKADSDDVIVFVHGSGSGASGHSNFKTNYPFLAENNCRVIIPDLIGYGRSDKPDDVEYHIDFFVECLRQLVTSLTDKKVILVGNSLGGGISIRYALDYPQEVAGLVLMAPGGIENQPDYFTMPGMKVMKETFAENKTREGLGDFIRKGLVHEKNAHLVDEELLAERWEIAQLQNAQVIQTMVVPNMTSELKNIQCPVLAFWGMDEQMMPASGIQNLTQNIQNIKLVLVSQCGHWVMAEHTPLFNRYTLDFVKNLDSY